jgi:hypothetical protein
MTDDGYLHGELSNSATGALYIAVTDHRPDPGDAWGRLQSNTDILAVADA